MGQPVTYLGALGTGHGCWPPRANDEGNSVNVFVNGILVHCVGDNWPLHCCPTVPPFPECHTGTLASGSTTVFVGGDGIGRVGDPVSCGSFVAQGSSNVFAG